MSDNFKIGLFKSLALLKDYLSEILVVGGWVPYLYYQYYLKDKNIQPLLTKDIDIALPKILPVKNKAIADILKEAGFKENFTSLDELPAIAFYGNIEGHDVEIEFITDLKGSRDDKNKNIQKGLIAQPLRYISVLTENPLLIEIDDFLLEDNNFLKIRIPKPGAFIFHKILTFRRRKEKAKKAKDLYYIFDILANCPGLNEEIINGIKDIRQAHTAWFRQFMNNLNNHIVAANSDAVYLITSQKPEKAFANLNEEQFKQYILSIFMEFQKNFKFFA